MHFKTLQPFLTNNHNLSKNTLMIISSLVFHLIPHHSLCECSNLLVGWSHFGLVVGIFFFVNNNLLQALISDLFVVGKHLLQLGVQVLTFILPVLFFRLVDLLQLLNFLFSVSLISFKMLILTGKSVFSTHKCARSFLAFGEVPLEWFELSLFIRKKLLDIFQFDLSRVFSDYGLITLTLESNWKVLALLEFILHWF